MSLNLFPRVPGSHLRIIPCYLDEAGSQDDLGTHELSMGPSVEGMEPITRVSAPTR